MRSHFYGMLWSWSCRTEMEACWKQNTFYLLLHSNSPVKAKLTGCLTSLSIMLPITTFKWCLGPSGWTLWTIQASLSERRSVSVCQMLQDFWWQWWGECSNSPAFIYLLSGGRKSTQQPAREGNGYIKEYQTFLPVWPFSSCIGMLKKMIEKRIICITYEHGLTKFTEWCKMRRVIPTIWWASIYLGPVNKRHESGKYQGVPPGECVQRENMGQHASTVCVCVFWEDSLGQTHKRPAADLRVDDLLSC